MSKQQVSYKLYLSPEAVQAVETLKDHAVNIQVFLRMALINAAISLQEGDRH